VISGFFKKLLWARAVRFDAEGVELLGLKGIIIPLRAFCEFQRSLEDNVGRERTKDEIKAFGRFQGDLTASHALKNLGRVSRKLLQFEIALAELLGWGKFTVVKMDVEKIRAVIRVDSNFAKEYRTRFGGSDHPVDYYLEGLLEGFASRFIDRKVVTREEVCIAQGKRLCEFIMKAVK
jgi:predicted hydrocarbon binding protein